MRKLIAGVGFFLGILPAWGMAFTVLSDDFTDNNYTSNPVWVVEQGEFAADGTDIGNDYGQGAGSGMLAFGTGTAVTERSRIHLDIPEVAATSPVTVEFDLFQSNATCPTVTPDYWFIVRIIDTQTVGNNTYTLRGWSGPTAYGSGAGASGFISYTSTGTAKAGVAGKSLLNGWQHVKIEFNPESGVTMWYGGEQVSSFSNFYNLTRIDQLTFLSGGTLSWFVDNVHVFSGMVEPGPQEIVDDFSDNDYIYNPTWIVETGQFAADGTTIENYYGLYAGSGMLAFGTSATEFATIHLDFPIEGTEYPARIDFDLFQSDDADNDVDIFTFSFELMDIFSGQKYRIGASTYPEYYGDSYVSGFSSYATTGIVAPGEEDKSLKNGWQHVTITFDPIDGVEMHYGGELVSAFTNVKNLSRINRLILSSGGTLSWFVDNVHIVTGTTPPVFSQSDGYIAGPTPITISCPIEGATIYYTTQAGTMPTTAGEPHTAPVTVMVNDGDVINAIAVVGNYPASVVRSMTFEYNPARVELSRGHYLLIEKGLQIQAWTFPNLAQSFNQANWNLSNFTTVNTVWTPYSSISYLTSISDMPWARLLTATDDIRHAETPYLSDLVSLQLGDEQALSSATISGIAEQMTSLRSRFPEVILHTNQYGNQATTAQLESYMAQAQPDMLMFDNYPFNGSVAGGSPTLFYQYMQKYRLLGLYGSDDPIPYALYTQAYTGDGLTHVASESEVRLNQFAAWAFGYKFISTFLYTWPNHHDINTTLFTGTSDTTPTAQFTQMAQTNRQSRNLGLALVRLLSTDVRMIMGQYAQNTANPTPSGITTGLDGADAYLTGAAAQNLGSKNGTLPGDVIIGFFKPLHEAFDGDEYSNEVYFMVVNGLSDATGTAAETRQKITLTFNMGSSGITSLQRLSRSTGKVETVPLTPNGATYKLELTLDGGTGDLFKYNTGAPFVGVAEVVRLSGDANGDRKVDVGDLGILAANYGRNLQAQGVASNLWWGLGDFNEDGKVDVGDLGILAANYGSSGSGFEADYAKIFGETKATDDDAASTLCSGLGLPMIAGLALMGLMLVKLEE